jgi:hypothetical protein
MQMRDPDEQILLDDRGRPRRHAFIDIGDRQVREKFSDHVHAALLVNHPELFGDGRVSERLEPPGRSTSEAV